MYVPRWKEIADALDGDIRTGKLTCGALLPSETDLAAQWNVSRVTAHRAMHELQQRGLVVRKRRAGTVVAEQKTPATGRIAVFLNTGDFLEQEYLAGIRAGLPDEYDLLFCDIRGDAEREAQYLERMSSVTDGIISLPTCDPDNTELLNTLIQAGLNLVCVDCMPAGVNADAIISDNYAASLESLRFLTARGHRRIAHFTVNRMAISSLRERYEAYREVMQEVGETDVPRLLREFPYEVTRQAASPLQAVQDALFALMHQPERPTAMFCAHDYILSPVLQGCRALGISIPEDLEIVSFNDCPPFAPYLPGNIHRIVQQAHEMGKVAAEHLCRLLSGERRTPEIVRIAPLFYAAQEPQPQADTHNPTPSGSTRGDGLLFLGKDRANVRAVVSEASRTAGSPAGGDKQKKASERATKQRQEIRDGR